MSVVIDVVRFVGRALRGLLSLVRDNRDDIEGTFPEHTKASQEQRTTQGSMGFMGLDGGAGPL